MPDRLSPLDVSFLYLEEPTTPMHVGSSWSSSPPRGGLDYERLVQHVAARIALVPRYRQRVRVGPGPARQPGLGRRRALRHQLPRARGRPCPGRAPRAARRARRPAAGPPARPRPPAVGAHPRRGPRRRPVRRRHQGPPGARRRRPRGRPRPGRARRQPRRRTTPPTQTWQPVTRAERRRARRVGASRTRCAARRSSSTRSGPASATARETAGKALEALGGLVFAARTATRPPPRSPLNRDITEHRRFAMVATDLEDYRRIRNHLLAGPASRRRRRVVGGRDVLASAPAAVPAVTTSVNDVVLATLAGALRAWLLTRGEPVPPASVVRALVPMSVRVIEPADAGAIGSRVGSLLVDLPTGEPSPLDAAAPGRLPDQGAPRGRPGGRRPGARRASPGSRRRRCTRSARGWPAACPAGCSTSS